MYRWSAGSIGGGAAGRAGRRQGAILTTWLIRAPPHRSGGPRTGRSVLAPGFLVPAPHGHSLRTGLRVVPPSVALRPAQTSHFISVTSRYDIIHANLRPLIFLPSDRSETGALHASAECSWTLRPCTFPSESDRTKPVQSVGSRRLPSDEIWPSDVAVTRGLRCCARERLATVPRNVRIC